MTSSFKSEPVRGAGPPHPAGRADGGVGPDILRTQFVSKLKQVSALSSHFRYALVMCPET